MRNKGKRAEGERWTEDEEITEEMERMQKWKKLRG